MGRAEWHCMFLTPMHVFITFIPHCLAPAECLRVPYNIKYNYNNTKWERKYKPDKIPTIRQQISHPLATPGGSIRYNQRKSEKAPSLPVYEKLTARKQGRPLKGESSMISGGGGQATTAEKAFFPVPTIQTSLASGTTRTASTVHYTTCEGQ